MASEALKLVALKIASAANLVRPNGHGPWVVPYDEARHLLFEFQNVGVVIVGGDVWLLKHGRFEIAESWDCSRCEGEDQRDLAARSLMVAQNAIETCNLRYSPELTYIAFVIKDAFTNEPLLRI